MRQISASRGAAFVLAVFPDRRAYRQPAEKRMAAFNASSLLRGTKIVDMAERFRDRGLAFEDIALDDIGHLGVRGHAVAAEVLEAELRTLAP